MEQIKTTYELTSLTTEVDKSNAMFKYVATYVFDGFPDKITIQKYFEYGCKNIPTSIEEFQCRECGRKKED